MLNKTQIVYKFNANDQFSLI